jgi:hypothetical protein
MGNVEMNCLRQRGVNRSEIKTVIKEDFAVGDEYKKKVTKDEILKALVSEKSRAPQQARTYDKGGVRVSVF